MGIVRSSNLSTIPHRWWPSPHLECSVVTPPNSTRANDPRMHTNPWALTANHQPNFWSASCTLALSQPFTYHPLQGTHATFSNRPLLTQTHSPTAYHAWDGHLPSITSILPPRNPGYYTNPSRSQISLKNVKIPKIMNGPWCMSPIFEFERPYLRG